MIAASIFELPMRSARARMIFPLATIATFVVPPPISTTAEACGSSALTPQPKAAASLADKVSEHRLRSFKIRHDAVEHRRDHCHAARLASVLLSCFATNVYYLAGCGLDRNQRRLVNHHAAPTHGNDRRGRSHVYRHVRHRSD